MNIFTDISIKLTTDDIIQAITKGKRDSSWMRSEIDNALEESQNLWDPKIIYTWADVIKVNKQSLLLAHKTCPENINLLLGPHAGIIQKAEKVFIIVCTIGEKPDKYIRELNEKGEILRAFLMDCIAVAGLNRVTNAASILAEKKTVNRSWSQGPLLSPGSLQGWDIKEQFKLCSMLPLKDSGITLNNSIFNPLKTISGLIAIGPGYSGKNKGTDCRFCTNKNNCQYKSFVK